MSTADTLDALSKLYLSIKTLSHHSFNNTGLLGIQQLQITEVNLLSAPYQKVESTWQFRTIFFILWWSIFFIVDRSTSAYRNGSNVRPIVAAKKLRLITFMGYKLMSYLLKGLPWFQT